MGKVNHLTDKERFAIEKAAREGLSYNEIGRLVGRSKTCVEHEIKKTAEDRRDYCAVKAIAFAKTANERRSSKLRVEVTEKQREIIIACSKENMCVKSIAQRAGVSRHMAKRILDEEGINVQVISPKTLSEEVGALREQVMLLAELIKEIYGSHSKNE